MFATRHGYVLHKERECRGLTHMRIVDKEDYHHFSLCRFCALPRCLICRDVSNIACPCNEHAMCRQCMNDYISGLSKTDLASLTCPCGDKRPFDVQSLPTALHSKWIAKLTKTASATIPPCPVSHIVDNILTNSCPHCNRKYENFDGCAAVACECGEWFCGLCGCKCSGFDDAHAHVKICDYNRFSGELFFSRKEITDIETDRKLRHVFEYLRNIRRQRGLFFTIGVFINVAPLLDVPIRYIMPYITLCIRAMTIFMCTFIVSDVCFQICFRFV